MTNSVNASPAPWFYEFSPYTLQTAGNADDDGKELPAFEIFDVEGNKIFDTNEDLPSEIQEANASLATAAPALLMALEAIIGYAENEAHSLEKMKDSPEAEAEAERAWKAVESARDAIAQASGTGVISPPAETDIHALLALRRQIAVVWDVEDVTSLRSDLTGGQAWEVLQAARRAHDATIGINWDVLDCHAEMLFGDAAETNEPEEA